MFRMPWCIPIALLIFVLAPITAFPQITDNFDDGIMNPALWAPFIDGVGPVAVEKQGYLEVTIPPDAREADAPHSFGGGFKSVKFLRGDFDIQVDYFLLDWPDGSGVRVGLGLFPVSPGQMGSVQRGSFGPPENGPKELYATDFQTSGGGVPSDHRSGSLRLARISDKLTSGVMVDGEWVELHSGQFSADDYYFAITAWSHDYAFSHQQVKVAFDNLIIHHGELVGKSGRPLKVTGTAQATSTKASATPQSPTFKSSQLIVMPYGRPFHRMPELPNGSAPAKCGPYSRLRISLPSRGSGGNPTPGTAQK